MDNAEVVVLSIGLVGTFVWTVLGTFMVELNTLIKNN